jgi:uncharacterized membrane protein
MRLKNIITGIIAILIVVYPFLIYFGINYFNFRYMILLLGFIFFLRIILLSQKRKKFNTPMKIVSILTTIIGLMVCIIGLCVDNPIIIKLYPVCINLLFLGVFLYSYIYPPSIIEKLARVTNPDLPTQAINYTHKVTLVWCIFFTINATISTYTVFFCSLHTWTIYNGLIAYFLIALIFIVEYVIRLFVKRKIKN